MAAFQLLSRKSGRRPDARQSLGWTALILLIAEPASLDQPGFQLSFCAVLGIVTWGRETSLPWLPETARTTPAGFTRRHPVVAPDIGCDDGDDGSCRRLPLRSGASVGAGVDSRCVSARYDHLARRATQRSRRHGHPWTRARRRLADRPGGPRADYDPLTGRRHSRQLRRGRTSRTVADFRGRDRPDARTPPESVSSPTAPRSCAPGILLPRSVDRRRPRGDHPLRLRRHELHTHSYDSPGFDSRGFRSS